MLKELVILSGKGGTGKTSLAGSFAHLSNGSAIFADCDVDAADLHLILTPEILEKNDFYSGIEPVFDSNKCIGCGLCEEHCRFEAVEVIDGVATLGLDCEGCGVCKLVCPNDAVYLRPRLCGEWYVSKTRFGDFVHAKLGIATENSGKLVSFVREKAKEIAKAKGINTIIIDGPPGIGCPAIAAISQANAVLIVAEPTLSGLHDAERVIALAKHFGAQVLICVNKFDISPKMSHELKNLAEKTESVFCGEIPYNKAFSDAQIEKKSVVELNIEPLNSIIANIWKKITKIIM